MVREPMCIDLTSFDSLISTVISSKLPSRFGFFSLTKPIIFFILLIISTSAGLWAYNIGDTIKFTSIEPYKIIVTGRIKHFLSAFGEHVISEEVEKAMKLATANHNVTIREFTVAPNINPKQGLPRHEWYVEFETIPDDIKGFSATLEKEMISQNIYYKDLILGNIIQPLDIV